MEKLVLRFVSLFLLAYVAAAAKLPPQFETCSRKDPKLDVCLKNAVQNAIVTLKNGYQPLGVFPIDPLDVVELSIAQGSGPVSIDLTFKDLKIYGFKDAKLKNIKVDLDNYRFQSEAFIPQLSLKGKYEINGKVLILPITGKGNSLLDMSDVDAHVELVGKELKRDGKMYLQIEKFDFKFDLQKFRLNFENLFNGDKQLGDNMNKFINENWSEILAELKPAIQEAFGTLFAEISNRIFTKVPFKDIFPE